MMKRSLLAKWSGPNCRKKCPLLVVGASRTLQFHDMVVLANAGIRSEAATENRLQ